VQLEIEIRPEKHVLQNTLCAAGTSGILKSTFSDIFFRNVTFAKAKCKKNAKNAKRPENT
jgi:hypothetical protein